MMLPALSPEVFVEYGSHLRTPEGLKEAVRLQNISARHITTLEVMLFNLANLTPLRIAIGMVSPYFLDIDKLVLYVFELDVKKVSQSCRVLLICIISLVKFQISDSISTSIAALGNLQYLSIVYVGKGKAPELKRRLKIALAKDWSQGLSSLTTIKFFGNYLLRGGNKEWNSLS